MRIFTAFKMDDAMVCTAEAGYLGDTFGQPSIGGQFAYGDMHPHPAQHLKHTNVNSREPSVEVLHQSR